VASLPSWGRSLACVEDNGMAPAAGWSSLEITKIAVSALTPIVVAGAGYWINRRLRSLESAQWSQQKIVERRIQAYDDLAPDLNRLFCFFAYVGSWKETTPPEIISLKRTLDRCAHISAPLFDHGFLSLYTELLDCCFRTFGMWGADAKLRTLPDRRRQATGSAWHPDWDQYFSERHDVVSPSEVKTAYTGLMAYLANAIGATQVDSHMLGSSRIPVHYETGTISVISQIPEDNAVSG
jgi:hypothetical protein